MGVFAMPSLGADMEDGTLVEWLVGPGDSVARGDVIAVVETQKGAIEIEVFQDGVVHKLTAVIGAKLPVGSPMAVILGEGEALPQNAAPAPPKDTTRAPTALLQEMAAPVPPPAPALTNAPQPSVGSKASPAARARAAELNLTLADVKGTGPDGTIVLSDVEQVAGTTKVAQPKAGAKLDEMRKAIATAMARSKRTIPHFYLSQTIDFQLAADLLAARNAASDPKDRVLPGALYLRAAALAARAAPPLNGHYLDDGFKPSEAISPGIAIALRGGGLVAPALFDVLSSDLDATMAAMRDLVTRARAGRLKGSEMTGGTITVSILGDGEVDAMAGVIFPPQVALVGIGAPQTRPWVVDGSVVPRQIVTVTLSADHRVADGRQAARFLAAFNTALQNPETL